ncbi:MAG: hypothetical protein JWL68_3877 [Actinomycetia bacterium]|nr:hypothetical protein [Actinomycetes bacterium]
MRHTPPPARRLRAGAGPAVVTLAAPLLAVLGLLGAGCSAGASPASVPSLSSAGGSHPAGGSRAADLHAAAQCIRQHGVPGYADPVLTPSGAVYSDRRSIQDASQSVLAAVQAACGSVLARAQLNPMHEPPAPPQLVQAGVRAAQCMRAHGLPNDADPTANTPYTPGHGFGLGAREVPAGGKLSHGFQQAIHACAQLDAAEIRASTLSSLGQDG